MARSTLFDNQFRNTASLAPPGLRLASRSFCGCTCACIFTMKNDHGGWPWDEQACTAIPPHREYLPAAAAVAALTLLGAPPRTHTHTYTPRHKHTSPTTRSGGAPRTRHQFINMKMMAAVLTAHRRVNANVSREMQSPVYARTTQRRAPEGPLSVLSPPSLASYLSP